VRRALAVGRWVRREHGYAAIFTALLMVPMLGFAGFAVDVGSWYARGSSLQRAADAAALAGVVWQPDFAAAESAARAAATRNGFTNGVDNIQVLVSDVGDNQLQVQIIDDDVDLYLASLFIDNVAIGRQALSEYSQSVPLGSPANIIGAGEQTVSGMSTPSNAWAGMMAHCSNSKWGDLLSISSTDFSSSSCGSYDSPYFDPTGYEWVLDVPSTHSGVVAVQVFDAGYCTSRSGSNLPPTDKRNANMRFTLYAPDSTPLTFDDNPVWGIWEPTAGEGCNAWSTNAALTTDGTTGQWMIRTEILDSDGNQDYADRVNEKGGQNYFCAVGDFGVQIGLLRNDQRC